MPNIGLITLHTIIFVVMVIGLFSLIIPVMPGLTIIWIAALVYGLVTGFSWQIGIVFALITIFMLVGNISDNVLMGAGARKQGASWLAIGLALLAGIIGTLLIPPLGGLIAALIVLFLVEFIRVKDWRKALDTTGSMAKGCGWAFVLRFSLGVVMILLWILWAFVLFPGK